MMASGKRAFLYLQMYLGKLLTIDKLLNLDGNFIWHLFITPLLMKIEAPRQPTTQKQNKHKGRV